MYCVNTMFIHIFCLFLIICATLVITVHLDITIKVFTVTGMLKESVNKIHKVCNLIKCATFNHADSKIRQNNIQYNIQ